MHIGNFIKSELEKRGIPKAHAGRVLNKTGSGIDKDLHKDSLHQEVLTQWSRFLGINLFQLIADDFAGKTYEESKESDVSTVNEDRESFTPSLKSDLQVLSVNISVPAEKQEAILKLLMSK